MSDSQLKTLEVLARIRMAWVALWFALVLFTITLLALLAAVFYLKTDTASKGFLGVIDSLLAIALTRVYWHLFPSPPVSRAGRGGVAKV
jgi:hypothetical protein